MENKNPVVKYDGKQTFTFRDIYPGAKPLEYAELTLNDKYQTVVKKLVEKYENEALDSYIAKARAELQKRAIRERWFFAVEQICQRFWDKAGRR